MTSVALLIYCVKKGSKEWDPSPGPSNCNPQEGQTIPKISHDGHALSKMEGEGDWIRQNDVTCKHDIFIVMQ